MKTFLWQIWNRIGVAAAHGRVGYDQAAGSGFYLGSGFGAASRVTRTQWGVCTLLAVLAMHLSLRAAEPRVVIVFGDSITAGSMLSGVDKAKVWVHLVEAQAAGKLQMINEGKGGRPTNSVKEFEDMLPKHPHADLLVLALGTNDSRDISEQCVPKAVENLRAMIGLARGTYGKSLAVLIVGPPNIRKDALGPTRPIADQRDGKLRELGDGFATLAKELHCDYFTLYGVVPEVSLAKDGVHPDPDGNEAIARVMLPKVVAALGN